MLSPEQVAAARQKYGITATKAPVSNPAVSSRLSDFDTAIGSSAGSAPESGTGNNPTFKAKDDDNPFVAGLKSLGNVPSSLIGLGKGIVHAAVHPIDTVKGILNAVEGAGEELTGHFNDTPEGQKARDTFDALKGSLTERYGSLDAARKTAEEDPIGFGADVMSIISGGAGLAGKTAELDSLISRIGGPAAGIVQKGADAAKIGKFTKPFTTGTVPPVATAKAGTTADRVSSFDSAMKQNFESEGIKAPVSAITKSPVIQQAEALASKTAFGEKIKNIATEAQSQLDTKVNELVSKVSPERTMSDDAVGKLLQTGADEFHKNLESHVESFRPKDTASSESLGKTLKAGLQEYEDNFKLNQGKIYDEFSSTYGKSNVYGQDTKDTLATLIAEQDKDFLGPDAIDNRLKAAFEKITGANHPEIKDLTSKIETLKNNTSLSAESKAKSIQALEKELSAKRIELDKPLSFEELKTTRTHLGELENKNPENTALRRLYGAMTNDMSTAVEKIGAQSPLDGDAQAAVDALKRLNEGYATGKNKIESNVAQSLSQSSPENIVQNIMKRNSADTLAQLKEMVGPQRFEEVQKAFMREVLDTAKNNGVYDPAKIRSALGEYDQETLNHLLTPDQQKNLQSVIKKLEENHAKSDIASSISKDGAEKIAQNIAKRNSAEYLKNVKDVVGEEKFKEVSKQFLKNQFEKSVTREKFDIVKFKKNLAAFDKETLDQILPPKDHVALDEAIAQFEKYKTMNDALKHGRKYTEGSQTAFLLQKISQKDRIFAALGAAATGHPMIAAGVALDFGGELLFSKLFTTDVGMKLLTEGFNPANLKRLKTLGLSGAQIETVKKALVPARYATNAEESDE